MNWIPAFPLAALAPSSAKVLHHGNDHIAVFRLEDGTVRAVDNRCPHEGYPLAQGAVVGCSLTCIWHNYKFDLRSGQCTQGEEDVRAFPVRVVGDLIEIDVTPVVTHLAPRWASLQAGVDGRRNGQVAREIVRLLHAGVRPAEIAARLAVADSLQSEWGMSHVAATAATILDDCSRLSGLDRAFPLAVPAALLSFGAGGRPARLPPPPVDPGDDFQAAEARFRTLVEGEDAAGAEALMRGAAHKDWRRAAAWMYPVCADHFLDFGHLLIYANKLQELIDAAGAEFAADLLGGWAWSAVNGTREDLLPKWAGHRKRLANGLPPPGPDVELDAFIEASSAEAYAQALRPGGLNALSIAAAERLLRYNLAVEADSGVQEGWLDVTHRLTGVNAVRAARTDAATRAKLTLHAAHFVATCRPLDGPRIRFESRSGPPETLAADLAAAVRDRNPEVALGCTLGLWQSAPGLLTPALRDVALSDRFALPIFAVHGIKTVAAAFEESTATADPRPILGAVRFLAAPVQERATRRLVHEAITLVSAGKPPTTLT